MGCGESTMKPVVVTTASPTSKLSPGLQMQQDALLQSKRSGHATPLITDAELESLKAAKNETGSTTTTTTTTTTATTSTGELNWADPLIWTGRMQECYDHYARQPDGELIDKKGMIQLAEDCVQSFLTTCTTDLTSKHKGWAETKIQSKVDFLRRQWLPGVTIQDVIDITKYWLAHEMKFRDGGVTKACFFLHFPRCHRQLFSYGGTITIEREQLVQKLNKQAMEKSLKSVKSSMASMKAGGSGEKGHIKNSSMSVRASKKGKTTRRTDSAAGSRNNMFDLDAIADDEGKKSTKKRSNKHSKASQELNTGKIDV